MARTCPLCVKGHETDLIGQVLGACEFHFLRSTILSTYFLICRTGFFVIFQYNQNHTNDIVSLFYGHTTSCQKKCYA